MPLILPAVRRAGRWLAPFGVYLLLALVMTWPLVMSLDQSVVRGTWWWDAYTNTMIMANRVHDLLGHGAGSLYDNYWFAPLSHTSVFNENELALCLLYLPFHLVGCQPITAYNLVLLLCLALNSFTMFLLAHHLTRNRLAALVAGAIYAFCPYLFFELPRLQLVAGMWIPLCFLFLHRALTRGRWTDAVGLALAYVLQVGTGMYYALFLLPLMLFTAAWITLSRQRATSRRRCWLRVTTTTLCGALVVAAMVWPYIVRKSDLDLDFSREYVARTDGVLTSFLRANPENRTWRILKRRDPRPGAESTAFPGLTPVLLALVAVIGPLLVRRRRLVPVGASPTSPTAALAAHWGVAVALSVAAVVAVRNGLAAVPVLALVAWHWRRHRPARVLPRATALYLGLVVLAVSLYLGLGWGAVAEREVVGLYDLLWRFVPGFQSVRRVERQAVMVMLAVAVLAAIGLSLLMGRARRPWRRTALALGALAAVLLEFRSAPLPLQPIVSASQVPSVYHWLRRQADPGPIAALPVRKGRKVFRGDIGGSLHNYLALFHRRRTAIGFSTWDSVLSQALNGELDELSGGSDPLPLLRAAGVRYLVVHEADLYRGELPGVRRYFSTLARFYLPAHRAGSDVVYRIAAPPLPLRDVPPRPAAPLRVIHPIREQWAEDVGLTATLPRAERVAAVEVRFPKGSSKRTNDRANYAVGRSVFSAPMAHAVDVSQDGRRWRTVLEQREPALYRDQIHRPARFLFRVVLPGEPRARAVRIRYLARPPITGSMLGKVVLLVR